MPYNLGQVAVFLKVTVVASHGTRGSCIAECVVSFLFYFGAVLTLFLARISLGDSYHSGGCDISSDGSVGGVLTLDFGGVITLELGGSMTGILSCAVRWCTRE